MTEKEMMNLSPEAESLWDLHETDDHTRISHTPRQRFMSFAQTLIDMPRMSDDLARLYNKLGNMDTVLVSDLGPNRVYVVKDDGNRWGPLVGIHVSKEKVNEGERFSAADPRLQQRLAAPCPAPKIYEYGITIDGYFVSAQEVFTTSLVEVFGEGDPHEDEIVESVVDALDCMVDNQRVHADMGPSKMVVGGKGRERRAVVLDFDPTRFVYIPTQVSVYVLLWMLLQIELKLKQSHEQMPGQMPYRPKFFRVILPLGLCLKDGLHNNSVVYNVGANDVFDRFWKSVESVEFSMDKILVGATGALIRETKKAQEAYTIDIRQDYMKLLDSLYRDCLKWE